MAWEQRGTKRYYYRSVRHGRHVTRTYIASGTRGMLAVALDAEARAERQAKAEAWQQARKDMEALDAQIAPGGTQATPSSIPTSPPMATTDTTEAPGANVPTPDEFVQLMRKADTGDKTVLPALRAAFETYPAVWRTTGRTGPHGAAVLVRRIAGEKHVALQELYYRKLTAMQEELAGPQPSPLERLLAERIVMCWLHLFYRGNHLRPDHAGSSLRHAEFHEQRLSKAQARYLAAIRTLAQVRRLGVPTVQINVAEQQVNLTG